MWFANWQGTPMFIALLTCTIIAEVLWNQVIAPALGLGQFAFDPNTWLLNLGLSLLASYAASLSVMGNKVQSEQLGNDIAALHELTTVIHDLTVKIHDLTTELAEKESHDG